MDLPLLVLTAEEFSLIVILTAVATGRDFLLCLLLTFLLFWMQRMVGFRWLKFPMVNLLSLAFIGLGMQENKYSWKIWQVLLRTNQKLTYWCVPGTFNNGMMHPIQWRFSGKQWLHFWFCKTTSHSHSGQVLRSDFCSFCRWTIGLWIICSLLYD